MIAGIFRAFLRPAHAQPVDDENSSLHVHVDAEGRAKDQLYWEKEKEREKEREKRRAAKLNTRVHPAAAESSIELTPRLPIFHGTGSPSTVGPVPSVNELIAPVLDRKATVFPAHGGGVATTSHLHTNPVVSVPSGLSPASQPRSGNIGITSATYGMNEGHDHIIPPGAFNEPSAEECMAVAAVEAARQREEEDALSGPALPLPPQSPVISEMDYRTMNLSPGPQLSFIEPLEPIDQPIAHEALQALPLTPQSKTSKRVSTLLAPTTPNKTIVPNTTPGASGNGDGGVSSSGVTQDGKLRKHRTSRKAPEAEIPILAGERKEMDKGKEREHHIHTATATSSSSKKEKDKTKHKGRSKDKHKSKVDGEGGDKKKKPRSKHKHKHPIGGDQPGPALDQIHKEKENLPPPAAKPPVILPPAGILKPTEVTKDSDTYADGTVHKSRSHKHRHSTVDPNDPDAGKKKVKFRTPEEEAAHQLRKAERRKARQEAKTSQNDDKGHGSTEPTRAEGDLGMEDKSREKEKSSKHKKHRDKHKSSSKHKRREGETEEERSERKAARRARKLAESLKAEASVPSTVAPLPEGGQRHSTHIGYSGRVLSPVPEASVEPAESIPPSGYPYQRTLSIPNLPELPGGEVPSGAILEDPVAYTEGQIPPRPSTPPPATFSSQGNFLPQQAARRRSYEEKIVVLPETSIQSHQPESSRRSSRKNKAPMVTPVVAEPVMVPESREDRRKRKTEQATSQPFPPPPAAIVPPDDAHAAREHKKKQRTPEQIEAKRLRKEARKAKVAAANAALQAINEDELLVTNPAAPRTKDPQPEMSAYQANAQRRGSVVGFHHPDPSTQPGYGHYGFGIEGSAGGLTSPAPGKRPKHKKSVTIDTGARGGGPAYGRDRRDKEREAERERLRKQQEKQEKEAKQKEAKANAKAQNNTGKRFGMFSLKRSFSRLFRA